MLRLAVLLAVAALAAPSAAAQVTDTLLVWQTYGSQARAHVRVFPSNDEARPLTAVVDELAENRGGLVTDDARFFAETLGRSLGQDPAGITFVFRFSASSFSADARPGGKTLLLRATFTRTRTGRLSPPQWRVINRDELAELIDRAFY